MPEAQPEAEMVPEELLTTTVPDTELVTLTVPEVVGGPEVLTVPEEVMQLLPELVAVPVRAAEADVEGEAVPDTEMVTVRVTPPRPTEAEGEPELLPTVLTELEPDLQPEAEKLLVTVAELLQA